MKKITLLTGFITCMTCVSFAGSQPKKIKVKQKNSKVSLSRQCCTKSAITESGGIITITACAGSFLSNDASSLERACNKAQTALTANL